MTGGNLFRKTKKIILRGTSSSRTETDRNDDSLNVQTQEEFQAENEFSGIQQARRHSFHASSSHVGGDSDSIWLIDEAGTPVRRRGRTTCADIQNMPAGTRIHIEINDMGIPCNIPESILLGSYLGVIAKDPTLAPINFLDWRNKGLEQFKKKMITEIEGKFSYPEHIKSWILQSIGVKWRNHKSNLKAEYFDSRAMSDIMENVSDGVDASQWCQLVDRWFQPSDKERAKKNMENAKKQKCPHTMGRVSSVRRQIEMETKNRLLLWRTNRLRKDGSWSSEDAQQRWEQACELLRGEGLTPEDLNAEANERVFSLVMGPEHGGRVRSAGFGVTPTKFFPHSVRMSGQSSSDRDIGAVHKLQQEFNAFQAEMRTFMEEFRSSNSRNQRSNMDIDEEASD